MWKNWLTLSSSDSPEIAFTFVKATRTKREEDERSPGRPNPPRIVNIVKEIQETDIPKLSHYADKEANPLYPVPKLMDASELEKFYYMLMSLTSKENTSEAEK